MCIIIDRYNLKNLQKGLHRNLWRESTYLVPRMRFYLWELKFSIVWIHTFYLLPGGCPQDLYNKLNTWNFILLSFLTYLNFQNFCEYKQHVHEKDKYSIGYCRHDSMEISGLSLVFFPRKSQIVSYFIQIM